MLALITRRRNATTKELQEFTPVILATQKAESRRISGLFFKIFY
jgi:hypothetical protein